jgi:hypothetical protein
MEITVTGNRIPAMSSSAIAKVNALADFSRQHDQVKIDTHHIIHGGMYARTITIPAGVMLTGVLIKVPTVLVLNGDCTVFADNKSYRLSGFHAIPASANRKQAFIAHSDTSMTMILASDATTVAQAENQFTDEGDELFSRNEDARNFINITGE